MKKPRDKSPQPGALEIIEQATSLLRRVPASAWVVQAGGTLLFIMTTLKFLADMGKAADAAQRLVPASLGLALAYGLMKHAHALFGHAMLDVLQGGDGRLPRLGWRDHLRLFSSQLLIHATMPWLMFLSLFAMLPTAWTQAAYHNASILAVGSMRRGDGLRALCSEALRASHHAPRQNHGLLVAVSVIALLLGLNILATAMFLPQLARLLSGSENAMSLNPLAMFNTTVIGAVVMLTWFAINPFSRACYALRCFHFVSRRNGDDLRAGWRALARATVAVVVLGVFLLPPAARADDRHVDALDIVPWGFRTSAPNPSPQPSPRLGGERGTHQFPFASGIRVGLDKSGSVFPSPPSQHGDANVHLPASLAPLGERAGVRGWSEVPPGILEPRGKGKVPPSLAAAVHSFACPMDVPASGESLVPSPCGITGDNPPNLTSAAPDGKPNGAPAVEKFNREMDDVLARPDFQWRLPRPETPPDQDNWFNRMIIDIIQWIGNSMDQFGDLIIDFLRWLRGKEDADVDISKDTGDAADMGKVARIALIGLLVVLVIALCVLLVRWYANRGKTPAPVAAAAPVAVDLEDELVTADALPEDEWLRLAREKWASGDHRLAVRALFLGTLARLGETGLLAIASGKTNGIYLRELNRQSRAATPLREAFRENVGAFEATWYGDHPVGHVAFDQFSRNLETIRQHARPI